MNAYPSTIGLTFGDVLAHKAANAYTPTRRPKDYKPEFVVRARGKYQGTYNSLKEAQQAACWYAFKNKLHSSDVSVFITRLDEYDHIWEERVWYSGMPQLWYTWRWYLLLVPWVQV